MQVLNIFIYKEKNRKLDYSMTKTLKNQKFYP